VACQVLEVVAGRLHTHHHHLRLGMGLGLANRLTQLIEPTLVDVYLKRLFHDLTQTVVDQRHAKVFVNIYGDAQNLEVLYLKYRWLWYRPPANAMIPGAYMLNNESTDKKANVFITRHHLLAEALTSAGLDALVLNPGPTLTYLTGLHFHLMERPIAVVFTHKQGFAVILPELERAKLTNLPFSVQVFAFSDDPETWQAVYTKAIEVMQIDNSHIGVEPNRFRILELRYIETAAPNSLIVSAGNVVARLRMRKDTTEISAMRKVVEIAQNALQSTIPTIRIGMTERDIASELLLQLLRAGTQTEVPFPPTVSSGPNSANPHAYPSLRRLTPGDLLVIDWGASFDGYVSDITRTFAIGEIKPELVKIYDIVKQANAAGRAIGRPGIAAGEVDRAARTVIDSAGYGKYFIHRTGHGLGMEGHEEPYMHAGNPLPLAQGMTFTVEPGIYLPDYNGVRIEDDVVITDAGAESLSDFSRDLITIG
jgi:Xaa-Pro dipeptidase